MFHSRTPRMQPFTYFAKLSVAFRLYASAAGLKHKHPIFDSLSDHKETVICGGHKKELQPREQFNKPYLSLKEKGWQKHLRIPGFGKNKSEGWEKYFETCMILLRKPYNIGLVFLIVLVWITSQVPTHTFSLGCWAKPIC